MNGCTPLDLLIVVQASDWTSRSLDDRSRQPVHDVQFELRVVGGLRELAGDPDPWPSMHLRSTAPRKGR
jgi:hypothetical protein